MNALTHIPAADRCVALSDNLPPEALPVVVARPTLIELARKTWRALSDWLSDVPAITTHEEAKQATDWIASVKRSLDELDDERRAKVDPLNAEVKAINAAYKPVREAFTNDAGRGLLDEAKRRLAAFMLAEEERRRAEAEALRRAAEEAEALAREAEAIEADAKARADVGECDIDVGSVIAQADEFFAEYQQISRAAARAEKHTTVRVATRFGRATSMRNKEELTVTDAAAAIAAVGLTDKIRDAILSAARDYRKLNGALPAGVTSTIERGL